MSPNEFWESTYKEVFIFVKANRDAEEERFKQQVILFEGLGNKILYNFAKHPKNINLPRDVFPRLFQEELKKERNPEEQSLDEMVRNLRARC